MTTTTALYDLFGPHVGHTLTLEQLQVDGPIGLVCLNCEGNDEVLLDTDTQDIIGLDGEP